ncbi:DUF3011 domain-containing protein [Aquisalinus flavus]|nr:DUF3011 domain-containing protein [Aquisalinus flavus]MBD0428092.1 DUF3011 domain-containing protein [Aquisalinus flavus]
MTHTPTRPSAAKRFGLGAFSAALAGGLMILTGTASAQTLSVQVGSSNYDRDYRSGGSTRTVYCESDDMRYETCYLGGNVQRVYLQDRKSNSSCYEGRDWGYDRTRIWVRNGCRANFGVVYAGGYSGGYDRGYDRGYDNDRYDRPGYGYGRDDLSARRDAAVRSCIAVANSRLSNEGRYGYRFDKVNFATPDRDGYGWTVGLEYDYGRGYRSGDRDIVCKYERGQAWLTSYRYSGYDDRYDRDRDRGRGRH